MSTTNNPGLLKIQDIDDLIEVLKKIRSKKGNMPVHVRYTEFSKKPIILKVGGGTINSDEPYLLADIQLCHNGDLIEGI